MTACFECAANSPVYSAKPCCQDRLERDMRRHSIVREAVRILGLNELQDRQAAIAMATRQNGEEFGNELKAEISRRWRAAKGTA